MSLRNFTVSWHFSGMKVSRKCLWIIDLFDIWGNLFFDVTQIYNVMFVDNVFTEFIEFLDNKIAYATTALSDGFYSIHLCLVFLQIGDLSPLQFGFFLMH